MFLMEVREWLIFETVRLWVLIAGLFILGIGCIDLGLFCFSFVVCLMISLNFLTICDVGFECWWGWLGLLFKWVRSREGDNVGRLDGIREIVVRDCEVEWGGILQKFSRVSESSCYHPSGSKGGYRWGCIYGACCVSGDIWIDTWRCDVMWCDGTWVLWLWPQCDSRSIKRLSRWSLMKSEFCYLIFIIIWYQEGSYFILK